MFYSRIILLIIAVCIAAPGEQTDIFSKHQADFPESDSSKIFTGELSNSVFHLGALTRLDTTKSKIYLTFSGGEFADGGEHIADVLEAKNVKANFFFTGDFYRTEDFKPLIESLIQDGHYVGPHSDKHLLYADWNNRDSTLVTKEEFLNDLNNNYNIMNDYGISKEEAYIFMPPYEWYNKKISKWCKEAGVFLVNFTPGTRSNADYTTPDMENYVSSKEIIENIFNYEETAESGMNGFILLMHIGTSPKRKDKLYDHLDLIINELRNRGYSFERLDAGIEN